MARKKDTRGPRERAYDEHMAPLVAQLSKLADEHGIPLIIDAELDAVAGDDTNPLRCTTLRGDPKSLAHKRANVALQPQRAVTFGMVIRTG